MTDEPADLLDRAREELAAAEALLDAGFPSQALARAYTAALRAGEATLLFLDEPASTPAGVVSGFTRRVVVQGGLDPDFGRAFRRLYEDRRDVDYAMADVPPGEARRAVGEARDLVDAASGWIATRAADEPAA
jgi:uncharacterized protein (UPF0332 family)